MGWNRSQKCKGQQNARQMDCPFASALASEGRSDTFELARHVSEHQSRLRAATRKIMATVSELSMYQVGWGALYRQALSCMHAIGRLILAAPKLSMHQ
eukprot:scaffold144832_cov17-Tisochrysis_lutea.AAC.1